MDDTPSLNDLAKRRLAQLQETGLRLVRGADDTVRLRLADGREVDFRLDPEVWQYRYRGARRVPGTERMERAILAALVALEASPVDPERKVGKDSKATRQGAHLRVGMQKLRKLGLDDLEAVDQAVANDPVLKNAGTAALQAEARLAFAEAVMRHYGPDFDDLPEPERILLLMHAGRHVDDALRAIGALHEFAQAGGPDGRIKKKAADPQQSIRAAELADALGLNHRMIGEILVVPLSASDRHHGGHRAVANMVERGRNLLKANLGEEGYHRHIETIRPDLERGHSLNARERLVQRMIEMTAGLTGRPLAEVEAMRPHFERLVDERFPEG